MSRAAHDNAHNGDRRKKRVYAPFRKNLMEIHDNVCSLIKIEIWPAPVYNFILQNKIMFAK